jgi:hypothetical protein
MVGVTEMGRVAATVYGGLQGMTSDQYLERMGPPLTPDIVGQGVVSLLTDDAYGKGTAFNITSQEITALN